MANKSPTHYLCTVKLSLLYLYKFLRYKNFKNKLFCGTPCIYIGETGRAFCTRSKEHMHDVNPKKLARLKSNDMNNKSALMKHVYLQNHHMD